MTRSVATYNDVIATHHVFLQRLIQSEINATTPTLARAKLFAQQAIDQGLTTRTVQQQIQDILADLYNILHPRLVNIATYEANFTYRSLYQHLLYKAPKPVTMGLPLLPVVNPPKQVIINKKLKTVPVILTINKPALTIPKTMQVFAKKKSADLAQVISDGRVQQHDNNKIKLAVVAIVTGLITYQLASLVGTLINKAASIGRAATYEENTDIVESVVWNTMLDDSVCPYCEDLEGEEMSVDEFDAEYPAHAGCQCYGEPTGYSFNLS